jgi:F-type H+-transporting ATPase subunit delta
VSTKLSEQISERYAGAFLDLGKSQSLVDQLGEDATLILAVLAQTPEFLGFLQSPVLKAEVKKSALVAAFKDKVHPFTLNFLQILVDRRRIFYMDAILQRYLDLLREYRKITLAEVTSAAALTPTQEQSIRERVIKMTGSSNVELNIKVDPRLLGGMIVRVGDKVIDASLKGQLRKLALQLT